MREWDDGIVLIAYVDESYDRDFYFVGAAIAEYDVWTDLASRYEAIRLTTRALHNVDAAAEFHGHELMGGAGDWKSLRGKHREAAGIYAAALRAAQEAGVSYLFRGVDVQRLNARYAYPRQPHDVAFSHLLERIDEYTDAHGHGEQTIVIADEIATQEQHQAEFVGYQRDGTSGYRSTRLEHISAPINFASSKLTPGLQAADMAVYLHRRRSTTVETHPQAQRVMTRLIDIVDASTAHRWTWEP